MRKLIFASITFCLASVIAAGSAVAQDCAPTGHDGLLSGLFGGHGHGNGNGSGHGGSGYEYDAYGLPKSHTGYTIAYDDHETAIIPKTRAVPPGWVIVANWHHPMGHGFGHNCWKIQRLPLYVGSTLVIAANQPIPAGWAVIEDVRTPFVPKHRAIKIQKM